MRLKLIVSLFIAICVGNNAYAISAKKVIFGGLAGLGAYTLIDKMIGNDTAATHTYVHSKNYDNDISKLENQMNRLGTAVSANQKDIAVLQNYVEALDEKIDKVDERVDELYEAKIGKHVQLQRLSSGMILRRSLVDANEMEKIGTQQYNESQTQCKNKMRKELKSLLKKDYIKKMFKMYNTQIVDLTIIDSTDALEDIPADVSLKTYEAKRKLSFIESFKTTRHFYQEGHGSDFSKSLFPSAYGSKYDPETFSATRIEYNGRVMTRNGGCSNIGGGSCWGPTFNDQFEVFNYKLVKSDPDYSVLSIKVALLEGDDEAICESPISNGLLNDYLTKSDTAELSVLSAISSLGTPLDKIGHAPGKQELSLSDKTEDARENLGEDLEQSGVNKQISTAVKL